MGVKTFTHNSPSHSQELLDKLNALRGEGHFCDVTVRVQGQLFAAHKVVLACCSDFLRAKLSGKPGAEEEEEEDEGGAECGEEGKPVVLDLHHVTVAGFAPLLEYAYTATLSISTENIIDVLAAASYMQMFSVASTCSEFMKSSILWNSPGPAGGGGGAPARPGGHRAQDTALSPSPVSSECSVAERPSAGRGSRRKRKGFARPRPAPSSSPQAPNPSPSSSSFPESSAQALEPSLAFSWTYPFGVDRRFGPEKSKLPEGLLEPSPEPSGRALAEYLSCEGGAEEEEEEEEDVQVKVERLSDEEVHEEASQPVSASHSSLSDQQTVPGSERHHEDLLISPQSSSIGSMDEGVTEGLQSVQGTPHTSSHMEEDERLENVQYPYHLYITPSTRPGLNGPERPFQCPTCGVRFTRIQNLKQHMLIHSDLPVQVERLEKAIRDLQSLPMPTLGSASGLKQDSQPQSEAQDEVVLDPEFNVRISKTRLRLCSHTDHRRLTNDLFDTFFSKEWQATHSLRGTSGVRGNPPKEALDKRVVNAITSIKPFQCDHCGKKFTRAYSLKMHRLKHEGKHCFRCQICRATFSSFVECKHHMRVSRNIVRKPRIYECKTCGAMFTNSGNLIVHLRSLNHEASELANYSQTSEFLLPEYLIQMQEEALRHFEMTDHAFTGSSSSSVQTPVIAQASSTQNCEPHPSALQPQTPPAREGQGEDAAREGGLDEPKTSASITSPEELDEQEEEEEREEHTWREALVSIKIE